MIADPNLLHALSPLAVAFALALARIGGVVMLLPGVGETVVPATLRAGFAVALTLLLMPSITMPSVVMPSVVMPAAQPSFIMLAALLAHELAIGIWLGLMARLFVLALPIAGQIISYQIGLSSVITPSQDLGAESTLLSTVFGVFATTMILATGLYALPLQALVASYHILPIGLNFPAGSVLHIAQILVAQSFALAVQLAMPFLLAGLLWQAGLAVISKLVPQLQIFMVAMPGQTLGGLAMLALLATAIAAAWQRAAATGMTRLLTG
jgi:flagellar biosynthetic protein FliR